MSAEYVPVSLPSKCLPYNDVQPDDIKLRPFKGKEEQLVAEMANSNPKKKLLQILRSVVQGIDPARLTSGDVAYIVLWEAINSYTNLFPVDLSCEGCYQTISINADLGRIDSKEISDDFTLDYEVDLTTKKVGMRLLTLADEIELLSLAQKDKSTYLYSFALSIVDPESGAYEIMLVLEELSSKELIPVRKFHTKFEHGPDFLAPYVCPKCGVEGKVIVPFRLDEIIQTCTES